MSVLWGDLFNVLWLIIIQNIQNKIKRIHIGAIDMIAIPLTYILATLNIGYPE